MFYNANGNFITDKILEGYSSEYDIKVDAFKEKIGYDEIVDSNQILQINSMIEQVVKDAEYQLSQMSGKTDDQVNEMKQVLKDSKQYNNLIRMLQYFSEQSFIMDELYHNQNSLYNSILEIDGWSSSADEETNFCEGVTDEIKETVDKYYSLKKELEDVILDYKRLTKQKRDNC